MLPTGIRTGMAMAIIDYSLVAVTASQLIVMQESEVFKGFSAYPCYWSPEIYNKPYAYPGRHWMWPATRDEREFVILGDERPGEPWNQRAIWRYGDEV
jgi:hypothetical protein